MYKVGDEVLVKGAITDLHEGTDHPYFVAVNYDSVHWVSEDKIIPADKTYEMGLNDAWELAKKIVLTNGLTVEELYSIFGYRAFETVLRHFTIEQALAKIETYEKEKEIKVGDVVKTIDGILCGVVTRISSVNSENAHVVWEDGATGDYMKSHLVKTGKHIDIESLLRQIGE